MIQFLDPRAEPAAAVEPYQLSIDLEAESEPTVGLLANGFPDSVNFLDQVGRALQQHVPGLHVRHYDKGNASVVCGEEMLAGISAECRAVITAYGH